MVQIIELGDALLSCEGWEQFWRCAGSPASARGSGGCVWMAPMLVRTHICHPEELSSFGTVLGMAMLGPHSPSALEGEKMSPPNDRLIPKMLAAHLGLWQTL